MTDITRSDQVILATASYQQDIIIWQAHTGNSVKRIDQLNSQVNAMEITPDRRRLAAAGYQHVSLFDLRTTENEIIHCKGISKNVTAVGFHEDGNCMFTGGEDCTAKIWDLRSSSKSRHHLSHIFQVNSPVNCAVLHPNQVYLFIGDQSGTIHIWDIRTDKCSQHIPDANASIQSIAIDPKGSYMAAVTNKGMVYIWDLTEDPDSIPITLTPVTSVKAHSTYALKAKFSPDSSMLITASADNTARLWNTSDFKQRTELKDASQGWVWDVAFTADSQYVITGSSDSNARLWCVETGEVKKKYSGHSKAISAIAFKDSPAE